MFKANVKFAVIRGDETVFDLAGRDQDSPNTIAE